MIQGVSANEYNYNIGKKNEQYHQGRVQAPLTRKPPIASIKEVSAKQAEIINKLLANEISTEEASKLISQVQPRTTGKVNPWQQSSAESIQSAKGFFASNNGTGEFSPVVKSEFGETDLGNKLDFLA